MLSFFKVINNKHRDYIINFARKLSKDNVLNIPPVTRSDRITSAIKLYVSKCNEAEKLIELERKEFEFGRQYLAKMMGADPETFTQSDIDESIRYLFPSGLFNEKARPIMTDPSNIYPVKKPLKCDHLGRPFDTFYYTARPVYHRIMHDAVYVLEKLKAIEDSSHRGVKQDYKKIELHSSRWMTHQELSEHCSERIRDEQFKNFSNLMNTIYNHPFNSAAEEFLQTMRLPIKKEEVSADLPTPIVDPVTGQRSVESYGQKKWTLATVKVTMPGRGKFVINNERLFDMVPLLSNRECILFPLQFTDTIGKIDIEATCKVSGQSSLAYALRLALSRALAVLLPEQEAMRLRLAGLLTQDERHKERKQPGKPKARKSAPWRPR